MATASTLLPDDEAPRSERVRRRSVSIRQWREDRRRDDPRVEVLGPDAVRAASAEPAGTKLARPNRTHHRASADLAALRDLLRPVHDWGVVAHALQAAEDPPAATGFHERLVPRRANIAPTGDEKRLERVDLLADGRQSGRGIPARATRGALDIRTHKLAETNARRRGSAEFAERQPCLVIDSYAGDSRASEPAQQEWPRTALLGLLFSARCPADRQSLAAVACASRWESVP
jgi:hypothetical protein